MSARRLSKSRFVAGQQCPKLLWWRVHEPDAPELVPDEGLQAIFDQGNDVGEAAQGHVPGGVLIDLPYDQIAGKVAATEEALAAGASAIYEASFMEDGVFVAVDILEREGDGWVLSEVKSTTRVKPQHIPDVAIQTHVVRAAGLEVVRSELMHLNRGCRYPDLSDLFTRSDVSEDIARHMPDLPDAIAAQLAMLDGDLPEVPIGEHCTDPYDCPFLGRCWPPRPAHSVRTLYRIGKRAADLEASGYETIDQLPDDVHLNAPAARQRRAVKSGELVVVPGLAEALAPLEPPLAFLDFETIAPAIPVWDGCRPYDAVPVQMSCHLLAEDGTLTQREWLASGPGDPRREMAEQILEACRSARRIVAYHAPFEARCVEALAVALPDLDPDLSALGDRLFDLLPPVRDHVYHPDFGGSFSIKAVLPALVADLSYEGMAIADGRTASTLLQRLLLNEDSFPEGEAATLRAGLIEYCGLDTLAMVRLLERLRNLGNG